jgi:phage virion morphogenesis protein
MEVKNINISTKELDKIAELLQKPKRLLNNIGNLLASEIGESFENERSPNGKKWKALKASTINARKRKGSSSEKILQDSYQLSESFDFSVRGNTIIVGTDKEYAAIHQFGGKAGRNKKVKIPARPFLPLKKKDNTLLSKMEDRIIELIDEYLSGALNRV